MRITLQCRPRLESSLSEHYIEDIPVYPDIKADQGGSTRCNGLVAALATGPTYLTTEHTQESTIGSVMTMIRVFGQ